MTENEQNEKSMERAREWFADHRARIIQNTPEAIIIDWRRPDTSLYGIKFIITGSSVVVLGDVGDAVYGFGGSLSLEQLTAFDWHYFINKCCASETGRNYTMKIPGIKHPVPNVRAIGHYIGLQMAIKQLIQAPAGGKPSEEDSEDL